MEHEQKSGAGLLRLLRLLWLLPHSWVVLEGKTVAPLCVRREWLSSPGDSIEEMSLGLSAGRGSVAVERVTDPEGEGCWSRMTSMYFKRSVCVLATFQKKKMRLCWLKGPEHVPFSKWGNDRSGV